MSLAYQNTMQPRRIFNRRQSRWPSLLRRAAVLALVLIAVT
jgi:hypothetical protein